MRIRHCVSGFADRTWPNLVVLNVDSSSEIVRFASAGFPTTSA